MDEVIPLVAARVTPIVLIIALGALVRRSALITPASVEDLKKLVVTIALPAVLFRAFLEMTLSSAYLALFGLVLAVCVLLYGYGLLLRRFGGEGAEYRPFMTTGFEFGMMGITLFGTAYGLEAVGYIAVVDVSHELFIWFFFVTMLRRKQGSLVDAATTLKSFVRSPVILAICGGLVLNVFGLGPTLARYPASAALLETLNVLAMLLIPTILLVIGYGLRIYRSALRAAAVTVVQRLAVVIPLTLLLLAVIDSRWVTLAPAFRPAVVTFMLLPPPFIVPIFMPQHPQRDQEYVNAVLSLHTAVSLLLFIGYFSLNPTLG